MSVCKYSWSFNKDDEVWDNDTFNTIEECIQAAQEENYLYGNQYNTVYIGEKKPFVPYVKADRVLDAMEDQAAEEYGETGYDWCAYDYRKQHELEELQNKLTEVVIEWMAKYEYSPKMWSIRDIRQYKLNCSSN